MSLVPRCHSPSTPRPRAVLASVSIHEPLLVSLASGLCIFCTYCHPLFCTLPFLQSFSSLSLVSPHPWQSLRPSKYYQFASLTVLSFVGFVSRSGPLVSVSIFCCCLWSLVSGLCYLLSTICCLSLLSAVYHLLSVSCFQSSDHLLLLLALLSLPDYSPSTPSVSPKYRLSRRCRPAYTCRSRAYAHRTTTGHSIYDGVHMHTHLHIYICPPAHTNPSRSPQSFCTRHQTQPIARRLPRSPRR